MDKKQYKDALELVKENAASQKCLKTLQELVELKSNGAFEITNKMKEIVKGYEEASAAVGNLESILELLLKSGNQVNVSVDAGFARGLEYYTGIIFEVYVPELDIALAGGGRYDKLIELFGGEPTPAVGIAHGIDRIMLAMQKQKTRLQVRKEKKVIVIPVEEKLKEKAMEISRLLRDAEIPVEVEVMGRKVSKALEDADRRKLDFAVIVGEKELREGAVVLRNLAKREQTKVKIEKIIAEVKRF
jgi:histidyl-tRNA synthetase